MSTNLSSLARVAFLDLSREYARLRDPIDSAIGRVLTRGSFILGPENDALEQEFAAYCEAQHGVTVGSGTDAVSLALQACGVCSGDEVITVSHTAVASVAAIRLAGAHPVLVDVEDNTLNMDPAATARAITERTKAIVAVHLYGLPTNLKALQEIAAAHGLVLIEDAAQAQGALCDGRPVGTFGQAAAFSFYPTKNLGGYGDGGIVVSNDAAVADRVRMLRQYGWGKRRYVSEIDGMNSRMDEIQAAIVRAKLSVLPVDDRTRQAHASAYDEGLAGLPLRLPARLSGMKHAFHLYVVRTPLRDELRAHLDHLGIDTAIHYPVPVHQQVPYHGTQAGALPNTERAAREILSLPIYPDLRPDELQRVIDGIRSFFAEHSG